MSLPEGDDVILRARSNDVIVAPVGTWVTIVGCKDGLATTVLVGGKRIGGSFGLNRFNDIRLIYPGDDDLDRILVLNDLLERRTPYQAGQQVTLDLAQDILGLIDTMHLPVPTTP